MSRDSMKVYGQLAIVIAFLLMLVILGKLFTGPLSFVSGLSEVTLTQWIEGALCLACTLMLARVVKREIIHGWLERRTGKQVPPLIGSLMSGLVIFIGLCLILALVFQRDITALVAIRRCLVMIWHCAARHHAGAVHRHPAERRATFPRRRFGTHQRPADRQGRAHHLATTVLQTGTTSSSTFPTFRSPSAVIQNMAQPDNRSKRIIELTIDYDTSVESAERILYAATLGAAGVTHVSPPTVFAASSPPTVCSTKSPSPSRTTATARRPSTRSSKSILQCMRDADIGISFPKAGSITIESRTRIANRSLDVFHLVQQVRLFRGFPQDLCHRISDLLIEHHVPAGAAIVRAGERRNSLFIVGEGMARRTASDREGASVELQSFIATEFFGRKPLFAGATHNATVLAETAVLIYEFDRRAFARLLRETPELANTFAAALAQLSWRDANHQNISEEPPPEAIERLRNLYLGQIEANYGGQLAVAAE